MTPAMYEACKQAIHIITPKGEVIKAGRAGIFILEAIGYPRWLTRPFTWLPLVWLTEWGYRLVADNRVFFSKFIFTEAQLTMSEKPLFKIFDTSITAEPSAAITPLILMGVGTRLAGWHDPTRSWPARLRIGLLTGIAYELAGLFHYLGHIISSLLADAPMDGVHFSYPMPRSIYHRNDDITPQQHIGRAIGGPLFSMMAVVGKLFLRLFTKPGSIIRDYLNVAILVNLFLGIGSLFPVPHVDGGVLLKWRLVETGQSTEEADKIIGKTNLFFNGILMGVVLFFLLWKKGKSK